MNTHAEARFHPLGKKLLKGHNSKMEKDKIKSSKKLDHSQIPIRKRDLLEELANHETDISNNLLYCICKGPNDPEYRLRLLDASLQAEHLARFVYYGKTGYRKLIRRHYERKLFLNYCESTGEVKDRLMRNKGTMEEEIADRILQKYLLIKDIWVEAITFFYETPFASELAYAADYVITHGNLPKPEFINWMFPTNYPDFDYSAGIGKDFFDIQMGNFLLR